MSQLRSVRGMHDALPEDARQMRAIEQTFEGVARDFGYEEIRMPTLEFSELYRRSVGESTDIVGKEMYSFEDRDGESLSLCPEGTAGCVRAAIQHGLVPNQQQRLWYRGAFFRRERPQRGRLRQFHQFGVEAFGMEGPDADAELLLMGALGWKRLGLQPRLALNTLGDEDERAQWRARLVEYFSGAASQLGDDDQRRMQSNPLRLLDSKSESMQELIAGAPPLSDFLGGASRAHFDGLREILDAQGITYELAPNLVRGLDYYDRTVFEWLSDDLGAQSALGGGGRYNRLVEQLGGKATPAAGFALGLERIRELVAEVEATVADVYLIALGEEASARAWSLAQDIRQNLPGVRVRMNMDGGSMKAQMRRADKSGARAALILGAEEVARGEITLKPLRDDQEQQTVILDNTAAELAEYFADLREPSWR